MVMQIIWLSISWMWFGFIAYDTDFAVHEFSDESTLFIMQYTYVHFQCSLLLPLSSCSFVLFLIVPFPLLSVCPSVCVSASINLSVVIFEVGEHQPPPPDPTETRTLSVNTGDEQTEDNHWPLCHYIYYTHACTHTLNDTSTHHQQNHSPHTYHMFTWRSIFSSRKI